MMAAVIKKYRIQREIRALKLELQAISNSRDLEDDLKAQLVLSLLKKINDLQSEI